jgi:hypothetical protein
MGEQVGRFTGFGVEKRAGSKPYLVERLMATVYRRCEVPRGLARDDLIAWASERSMASRRRMCVVFAPDDCVYVEPDGCWECSMRPPAGGAVVRG